MITRLAQCLRQNAVLLLTGFAGFLFASAVGALTVDAGSATPAAWLATMWVMLAFGAVIVVVVAVECVQVLLGSGE